LTNLNLAIFEDYSVDLDRIVKYSRQVVEVISWIRTIQSNSMVSTPISCKAPQVTIVGAGKVGSTTAQRIAEKDLADIFLLDVVAGLPQGIALDLTEAKGLETHDRRIIGTNDYKDTTGSDIIIITAGLARKPGMSRDDLIQVNAKIVTEAARRSLEHSPNAIIIVITNPLDVMTYLVWHVTALPKQRVMGMAGVLDSYRLAAFIAMELGISTADVRAMVLGGHGDLMLPLPRYCTASGVPITELMDGETIDRLVERTRNGGAEIVKLLQTGGAYFAPASSAFVMTEAILRDRSRILPTATYLDGEYGLRDIFLGVPCRLGCRGIESILEVELSAKERQDLQVSAASVRENIDIALKSLS
jgi:malate dehydrogenase